MLSSFEELAETRPRIRRDVLFTETPNGVLFHNSKGGVHINGKNAYRFTQLLTPHLNGEHRVENICDGLGEQQRSMIATLLATLFDRDFARDVPAVDTTGHAERLDPAVREVFDAQLNYIDHYADDATNRFARFRQTSVAVLGSGPVAEQCVLGLIRNGAGIVGIDETLGDPAGARAAELSRLEDARCPVEIPVLSDRDGPFGWTDLTGYDVVLVAGDTAAAQLHRLESEGVPKGVTALGAWAFGERAVVGPMLAGTNHASWTSAVLRLGANVSAADEAAVWAAVAAPDSVVVAPGLRGPLAAMVGNLLAYECFRFSTGALPAESADGVIIQDVNSLDVAVEPLLPQPVLAGGHEAPEPVLPDRADETERVEEVERVDETAPVPEVTALNAKATLVQPHAGVFTTFTDGRWTQTPLKVSSVRVNPTRSVSREIVAVDLHHVAGARLRALRAAALVHVKHTTRPRDLLHGEKLAVARAELPSLEPRELSIGNGTEPCGEAAVQGRVLASGATVLVPAETIQPTRARGTRSTQVTCAGEGAGDDVGHAAARGLATTLAHRALVLALRESTTVSRLDAAHLTGEAGAVNTPGAELRFLLRAAEILELDVELLDLGESARSGAHVVFTRTVEGAPSWAISCGLDRVEAARDALRDLLGLRQLWRESPPPSNGVPDPGDSLLADLDPALVAIGAEGPPSGGPTEWDDVVAALDGDGTDTVVVRTTPPNLATGGLETAKVFLRTRPGSAER